ATANPMVDFFNRVDVVSPAEWNGTVSSPVQIRATTSNDSTVRTVQVYVDDVLRKQTSGSSIDASVVLTPGAHTIVVQSWDTNGGIHQTSRRLQVSGTSLQILSPKPNSTVSSSVALQARGSENFREISVVVDGVPAARASGKFLMTTLSLLPGQHRLTFSGTLAKGASYSRSVSITAVSKTVTIANPANSTVLPSP